MFQPLWARDSQTRRIKEFREGIKDSVNGKLIEPYEPIEALENNSKTSECRPYILNQKPPHRELVFGRMAFPRNAKTAASA